MLDVLIIGAGPSGLRAAKTILESEDGNINLKIIDGNKTLGGVWAKENLYPGLTTNNLRGGIDFSDFPMDDSFGVKDGSPIPGEVMHEYLVAYAKKWDILPLINYETTVQEISRLEADNGWNVRVSRQGNDTHDNIETSKLIVATGVTNRPHHPKLPDTSSYNCPIIHSAHLGKQSSLVSSPSISTVTVLGGAKSAYDAVYLAASAGKKVHWIIRASGKGPVWVFPAYTQLGPIKAWRERLPVRRFISCFSPWMWDDGMNGLRSFLHESWLGKKITQAFWGDIHHATLRDCRYKDEDCLKVLEPEQSPFWYGTASGVNNYPGPNDLYHYIRTGQITIHRADITSFPSQSHAIALSNGTALPSDLLITATGFSAQPNITFHPSIAHSSLGLPSNNLTPQQTTFWSDLTSRADLLISTRFPRLLRGPFLSPKSNIPKPLDVADDDNARFTPWRLWRGIAPPGPTARGRHDLVFLGIFGNFGESVRLELMCLWAWAYLTGRLTALQALPPAENKNNGQSWAKEEPEVEKLGGREKMVFEETALWARYWHLRAPYGHGRYYPDAVFDQVPVWDLWMGDLGLGKWRKVVDENRAERRGEGRGSWVWRNVRLGGWTLRMWFRELFEAYTAGDYRGLVGEWKTVRRGGKM